MRRPMGLNRLMAAQETARTRMTRIEDANVDLEPGISGDIKPAHDALLRTRLDTEARRAVDLLRWPPQEEM